jgi:hypothetical protein
MAEFFASCDISGRWSMGIRFGIFVCTNIFITQPVMIVRVFCSQACPLLCAVSK